MDVHFPPNSIFYSDTRKQSGDIKFSFPNKLARRNLRHSMYLSPSITDSLGIDSDGRLVWEMFSVAIAIALFKISRHEESWYR